MTTFERAMLVADCREACKGNVLRTDDEAREVRQKGQAAATALGYEYPEDAVDANR